MSDLEPAASEARGRLTGLSNGRPASDCTRDRSGNSNHLSRRLSSVGLCHDFADEDAVLFDLETRSAADLRRVGGRRYAADPTTEILSLVAKIGDTLHVWQPSNIVNRCVSFIWPEGFNECETRIHWGDTLPQSLIQAVGQNKVFVAHNAADFDAHVWAAKIDPVPKRWYDTLHAARAGGYPGSLDELSKRLFGRGKDDGQEILRKLTRYKDGRPVPVQPGLYSVLLRYNVADVLLLEKVFRAVRHYGEPDVISAHQAVNDRGVCFDLGLAAKIRELSATAVEQSGAEIERLTGGTLTRGDLRSGPKMKRWLSARGVTLNDLRKETVRAFLTDPAADDARWKTAARVDPTVFPALRLRNAALRITGAKLGKALDRVGVDGRLRDLHTYHHAHTGRWSSAGVQIHNLPRPAKGVSVAGLCAAHDRGELCYETLQKVTEGNDAN